MSDLILPSAVYSETHSPKMSEKYVHIKTADVLSRFQDMGWGDKTPVTAEQLLLTRRDADKGSDLWRVFNRVQENLTQGGFSGGHL